MDSTANTRVDNYPVHVAIGGLTPARCLCGDDGLVFFGRDRPLHFEGNARELGPENLGYSSCIALLAPAFQERPY